MKLPTLYTRDVKGHVRIWEVEYEGTSYRTRQGIEGGIITTSEWTHCSATNEGRANSRDAYEQAKFQAEALWRKKMKTGAATSLEKSGAKFVQPMLARTLESLPAAGYVQPKLDGHRCLIWLDGEGHIRAHTRKGEPYRSIPHILEEVAKYLRPGLVLDGELYNHELKHEFERISSMVRKQKPTAEELDECRRHIEYHIYDLAVDTGEPFVRRLQTLHSMKWLDSSRYCRRVPTLQANSPDAFEAAEMQFVEAGYEGAMVRLAGMPYERNKRSKSLLKWKRFEDAEFRLIRFEEGNGNRKGLATLAVLDLGGGKQCSAGVMGNDAVAREYFLSRNKYAGRMFTVKFLGRTSSGALRCAKLKAEYKP